MDFTKINGYQFEEVICTLLKKMGFEVIQTSLSGDGGIDIFAIDNRPIFKGKYIIQCKNWINSIGQPQIRDLYGVVMSENANKGILITTSNFTKQARTFADNKNLELIDGIELTELLNKYEIAEISFESTIDYKKLNFYDFNNFKKDKYFYLKDKINSNKDELIYYEQMRAFLHEYIFNNYYEICTNGLLLEYINLNNETIKRFGKKGKKSRQYANNIKYLNGYLYLLEGEILKGIEIFNELKLFNLDTGIRFLPSCYQCTDIIRGEYKFEKIDSNSPLVIIKNLFLLFSYLNYDNGVNFLKKLVENTFKQKESLSFNGSFEMQRVKLEKGDIINEFILISNKESIKFHIPSHVIYSECFMAIYDENLFIPINDLINKYYSGKDFSKDFEKLNLILDETILKL